MCMCVCGGRASWYVPREGMRMAKKPALESSLQTCRLYAACPQAHSAWRLPGHTCPLRSLPTEQLSPHFKGSQLRVACGQQTPLAWSSSEGVGLYWGPEQMVWQGGWVTGGTRLNKRPSQLLNEGICLCRGNLHRPVVQKLFFQLQPPTQTAVPISALVSK